MKKENKKIIPVGKPINNRKKMNVIGGGAPPIKKGDIKKMNH